MGAVDNDKAADVYDRKFSTVVPGSVTGEDVVHELTNMDLVMKLHYLRTVYYFRQNETIERLSIVDMKDPMFPWLNVYYPTTGRVRRAEAAGRPLIKCNDCGVRIVEAKCGKTLEEWLQDEQRPAKWRQLVPDCALGPDLQFSPLVYLQFTKFKCGGMAIGYSWAHVLGDPVSAADCINLWGQLLGGNPPPPKSLHPPSSRIPTERPARQLPASPTPVSVKQVEPGVGDCWLITTNPSKLATDFICVTESKLKQLQSEKLKQVPAFEVITALFWYCLAKVRAGSRETRLVSICRNGTSGKRSGGALHNEQKISAVASDVSDVSPAEVGFSELMVLISKQEADETKLVEDLIDGSSGAPDVVVYGANLTFVDMSGVDLAGLELKGQKPVQVDFGIDGVGSEGAVLVFEAQQRSTHISGESKEGSVVVILPEEEILKLRAVLKTEFDIA